MPSPRASSWIGLGACAASLAFALYAQHGLGFVPCHLCIFQRVALAGMGVAFLVSALMPDGRGFRVACASLIGITGLATIATAGRHVWIQMQPAGTVAPCGADLEFMLDILPLTDVILKVFRAGGECANVDWTLLGLSMPAWVLVLAVVLTAGGIWVNLRRN